MSNIERPRCRLLKAVVASALALILVSGCADRSDATSHAEKSEKERPGIAETKAIAEEGFIYGLPIVMNYAVMYEFVIDKNSGQYKAPSTQASLPKSFAFYPSLVVLGLLFLS